MGDLSRATSEELREIVAERWDGTLSHYQRKQAARVELRRRMAWTRPTG